MTSFQSNEDFLAALRQQTERWCDQRRLNVLARLLLAYTSLREASGKTEVARYCRENGCGIAQRGDHV
jgi:hypothetical protein